MAVRTGYFKTYFILLTLRLSKAKWANVSGGVLVNGAVADIFISGGVFNSPLSANVSAGYNVWISLDLQKMSRIQTLQLSERFQLPGDKQTHLRASNIFRDVVGVVWQNIVS